MQARAFRAALLAAAMLATAQAGGAAAAPISFFSGVSQFQGNSDAGICGVARIVGGTSASTGSSCNSTETAAQATVGDGTLKALSTVTKADSGTFGVASADAVIGDSFRHFSDDAPFAWSGEIATFALDVSGVVSAGGNFANGSGVTLIILQPGALDLYAGYYLTGDPDLLAAYQAQQLDIFGWGLGDVDFSPLNGEVLAFPETLTADFTPGGDFDWVLRLSTSVTMGDGQTGTGTVDFFNTIELTYTAPEGIETRSASGVFPGTTALVAEVPEPSAYALLLAAMLPLAWGLRRRARRVA